MRTFFDFDHPFFRPLWRRIAIVAVCATWGTFEIVMASVGWGVFFLALAALCFWGLFVRFDPRDPDGDTPGKEPR